MFDTTALYYLMGGYEDLKDEALTKATFDDQTEATAYAQALLVEMTEILANWREEWEASEDDGIYEECEQWGYSPQQVEAVWDEFDADEVQKMVDAAYAWCPNGAKAERNAEVVLAAFLADPSWLVGSPEPLVLVSIAE
jgi:hypothetical protein